MIHKLIKIGALPILFLLGSTFLGCQSEPGAVPDKEAEVLLDLELVHELDDISITDHKSDRTSYTIYVDSSNSVYLFTDPRRKNYGELSSFSQDGSTAWKNDTQGEGPGELYGALGMAWNFEDRLFVGNQSGNRIDQFSLEGQFVESIYSSEFTDPMNPVVGISLVGFIDENHLVAMKQAYGKLGVHLLTASVGDTWVVTDTFTVDQTEQHSISPGVGFAPLVHTLGEHVIAGHLTRYEYTFYNPKGEVQRILSIPGRFFEPPVSEETKRGVVFKQFSSMYPLVEVGEYLVGGAEWPEDVDGKKYISRTARTERTLTYELLYSLDVFDAETGDYLASFDPRDYGIKKILASDSAGRVYAEFFDEERGIGCFNVNIVRL